MKNTLQANNNSTSSPEPTPVIPQTPNNSRPLLPLSERAVLKPAEFAAIFGHHQTWAYRQIYAGKIKVISDMGRFMIPRTEIDRLQKKQVSNY